MSKPQIELASNSTGDSKYIEVPPPETGSATAFHFFAALLLGTLCLALYANTFQSPFTFDDFNVIVENPSIRWRELSFQNVISAVLGPINRRPIAHFTIGLNYYFGGYEVWGYHAVNIAIHFLNGLLVYAFARTLFRHLKTVPGQARTLSGSNLGWAALLAGLLFVAHPLQTQSVTYVVQRMNSLATLFYLGGLLLYIRGRETKRRGAKYALFAAGAVSWFLAVGSKQNALTLPVAMGLYEWFFLRDLDREWALRCLKMFAAPIALGAFALYYVTVWGPDFGYAQRDFSMGERVLTQFRVVCFYISQIALPLPSRLSLMHGVSTSHSLLDPLTTLTSLLALLALFGFGCHVARSSRLLSFAIAWFFLHLLMESSILPLEMIYEHRTYLPMVAIAVWVAHVILTRIPHRASSFAIATVLVGALGLCTVWRNETWRDNVTLWSDAVAKYPDSARTHSNLGMAYQGIEKQDVAISHFLRALAIDPEHAESHRNLGASLLTKGDLAGALEHYEEAVRLEPGDYVAQGGLGAVFYRNGDIEKALHHHRLSLQIYADERVLNNLGKIFGELGDSERALYYLELARSRNPDALAPYVNIGLEMAKLSRLDEAIALFEHVLREVNDGETRAYLGSALWEKGEFASALEQLDAAHRSRPDLLFVANDLAWMLATCPIDELRDPPRAALIAEETLHRFGADADVLDTLAAAYAAGGRFDEAKRLAEEAELNSRAIGDEAAADDIADRVALYQAGIPYLERVKPTNPTATNAP